MEKYVEASCTKGSHQHQQKPRRPGKNTMQQNRVQWRPIEIQSTGNGRVLSQQRVFAWSGGGSQDTVAPNCQQNQPVYAQPMRQTIQIPVTYDPRHQDPCRRVHPQSFQGFQVSAFQRVEVPDQHTQQFMSLHPNHRIVTQRSLSMPGVMSPGTMSWSSPPPEQRRASFPTAAPVSDVSRVPAKDSSPCPPLSVGCKDFSATEEEKEEEECTVVEPHPVKKGIIVCPFPTKLYCMLEDPASQRFVSWLPHGRAFRVRKNRGEEKQVLLKFFRSGRFQSFQRQLSGWGFKRITRGEDTGAYYHEKFLRGFPGMCKKMGRVKQSDGPKKKAKSQDCPNFNNDHVFTPLPEPAPLETPETPHSAPKELAPTSSPPKTPTTEASDSSRSSVNEDLFLSSPVVPLSVLNDADDTEQEDRQDPPVPSTLDKTESEKPATALPLVSSQLSLIPSTRSSPSPASYSSLLDDPEDPLWDDLFPGSSSPIRDMMQSSTMNDVELDYLMDQNMALLPT